MTEEQNNEVRRRAQNGDSEAMFCLSIMSDDNNEKFKWLSQGAELGNRSCIADLAKLYRKGLGCERNPKKALSLFLKIADVDAYAALEAGEMLFKGDGVSVDYKKAFRCFKTAADSGNHYSFVWLGKCYEDGLGVEKDAALAFEYFNKATQKGVHESELKIGHCYELGVGVNLNLKLAKVWYAVPGTKSSNRELKRLGCAVWDVALQAFDESLYVLGMKIVESNALLKDEVLNADKVPFETRAKIFGRVGDCWFHGLGTRQNYQEAIKYYTRATQFGSDSDYNSMMQLSRCYFDGLGVEQDDEVGEKWMDRAQELEKSNVYFAKTLSKELGSKYCDKIVKVNVDNIIDLVSLFDLCVCTKKPWPPQEDTQEFRMGSGEVLHASLKGQHLYETVSSTNSQLKYVSTGTLAVTNKRFVLLSGDKLKSIPFREIEKFSSNWLCDGEGTITLSIKDRARSTVLRVGDAMLVSVIYWYYNSREFRQKFDEHKSYELYDLRRHELARWLYSKAEPNIDALKQKQKTSSVAPTGSGGSGCCVPFIAMIGAIVWLAKMCIC